MNNRIYNILQMKHNQLSTSFKSISIVFENIINYAICYK